MSVAPTIVDPSHGARYGVKLGLEGNPSFAWPSRSHHLGAADGLVSCMEFAAYPKRVEKVMP